MLRATPAAGSTSSPNSSPAPRPARASLTPSLVVALVVAVTGSLLVGAPAEAAPGTAPAPQAAKPSRKPTGFGFKIGTFNVLGSQHTRGPGGFGPGTQRARWTAGAITQRGIDVIGMQEVQRDQLRVFRNRMPGYRFWPGTRLGNQGIRLQIGYRTKEFRLVGHGKVMTRFDHQTRPIPWVKLRDRRTDRAFYVVDVHNSPRGMEAERDAATAEQVRLVQRLRRKGKPVLLTADANEKREFYCKMTARTDLRAANGGKARARGCKPPQRRLRIDWVLGGRRLTFSHYDEDRGPRVRRSSDHDLVHARVRVRPVRRG